MGQLKGWIEGLDQGFLVPAWCKATYSPDMRHLSAKVGRWISNSGGVVLVMELVFFCSCCSCFSSFLLGINYCGFMALTRGSWKLQLDESKN